MSGSPLSPKFPTVAIHLRKSYASVHGGGRIETPGTCAFNIHWLSIYLYVYLTLADLLGHYNGCTIIENALSKHQWLHQWFHMQLTKDGKHGYCNNNCRIEKKKILFDLSYILQMRHRSEIKRKRKLVCSCVHCHNQSIFGCLDIMDFITGHKTSFPIFLVLSRSLSLSPSPSLSLSLLSLSPSHSSPSLSLSLSLFSHIMIPAITHIWLSVVLLCKTLHTSLGARHRFLQEWREIVVALCPTGDEEEYKVGVSCKNLW